MIITTKWFQVKINNKDDKYYTLIGIFTNYWSAGIVHWKDKTYNWR